MGYLRRHQLCTVFYNAIAEPCSEFIYGYHHDMRINSAGYSRLKPLSTGLFDQDFDSQKQLSLTVHRFFYYKGVSNIILKFR